MNLCQFCNRNEITANLTKCCKLSICQECCEKFQQESLSHCFCGKPISKGLCSQNFKIFQIVSDYNRKKTPECDRCQNAVKFRCESCKMLFCSSCSREVHDSKGFRSHKIVTYSQQSFPEKLQTLKQRLIFCQFHKKEMSLICECSQLLCQQCAHSHKERCSSKHGKVQQLKQFREDFYPKILSKIKEIGEIKSRLQKDKNSFQEHFHQQKQLFIRLKNSIESQLLGLTKILQLKISQIQNQIDEYWKTCERVYEKTRFHITYNLGRFDDYSRLSEVFAENDIGLDYLERRVKPVEIPFQYVEIQPTQIEAVQSSLMQLQLKTNLWSEKFHPHIMVNLQEDPLMVVDKKNTSLKTSEIFGTKLSTQAEYLLECTNEPKKPRHLELQASHDSVEFSFIHLPHQNLSYEVQYGVGFKMKGEQVFKRIKNSSGNGQIDKLNPSTKYRFRMRIGSGEWGQIKEITTMNPPRFDASYSTICKVTSENAFQFIKQGTVYGSNPLSFGKHCWVVVINSEKAAYQESLTACISIGVSNKETKKPIFVGSTLNYGYQRQQITLNLTVDCEQKTLTVEGSNNLQERFQLHSLLPAPMYPAIQNKSSNSVHIRYSFGKQG